MPRPCYRSGRSRRAAASSLHSDQATKSVRPEKAGCLLGQRPRESSCKISKECTDEVARSAIEHSACDHGNPARHMHIIVVIEAAAFLDRCKGQVPRPGSGAKRA